MVIGKKMDAASIFNPLVQVRDLCFQRDWQLIFHNFNLDLFSAQGTLLKGRNGSGKTTLLKLLTGLLSPQSGTIHINGTYSYLGHQNGIKTYLTLTKLLSSLSLTKAQDCAFTLINQLEMQPYLDIPFIELSAGLKRRFALVQLLAPTVDLYIVDEPFEHLDRETAANVWSLFQEKINQGAAVLMAHHGLVPLDFPLREVSLDV